MTRVMRSPASDSRSGRINGMPPATDASNSRSTPAVSAASKSSSPKFASSSLFAVTTGLADFNAARIRPRAGSTPPMTSTTTSTFGSLTTASASLVRTPGASSTSRSLARLCTATRATSTLTPERWRMRSAFASSRRTSAAPTFPQPRMPTRTRSEAIISAPGAHGRRAARAPSHCSLSARGRSPHGFPQSRGRPAPFGTGDFADDYSSTSSRTRSASVSRRTTRRAVPSRTNTTGGRATLL